MRSSLSLFATFLTIISVQAQSRVGQAIQSYNDAKAAYMIGDYAGYLENMILADSLLPYSRPVKYNLAAAYAKNKRLDKSFQAIEQLIWIDTSIPFNEDSVFLELKADPQYEAYLEKSENQNVPISTSELAFELDEIDLHPESIAIDKKTGLFYISSLRKRKIITYDPESGEAYDWLTTDDIRDLYGVMGIKVTNDGESIWLCSSPLPEMEGYSEDGQYTPTVFKVDLRDKSDIERYALPIGVIPGDLEVSKKGDCYVSDSASPQIFRIRRGRAELYFEGSKDLVNLQGITISGDDMYLADYLAGVHRMSLSDKKPEPVKIKHPHNLAGADGLYFYDNSLIAIQNGLNPFRIGRYYLDKDNGVRNFEILDKGAEFLDEPTLGVIHDDVFYFVANSPWGYYQDGVLQTKEINKPQIRKINLK